jgi:CelD/BcsL family acetyltransferase involved in cellulose biosynthesis
MNDKYFIVVHNNICDEYLMKQWILLEEKSDCHPQMNYGWIKPWWKYHSNGRILHIVTVIDRCSNNVVGIAPLCIDNNIGVRILRSIPINYSDFYSFIIENTSNYTQIVFIILEYLKSFKCWNTIILSKISNKILLYQLLIQKNYFQKYLVENHVVDLSYNDFDNYLKNISYNARMQFKNKLKKLNKLGQINLEVINDYDNYLKYINTIKNIYKERWVNDRIKPPSDEYYAMQNEVVYNIATKDKFVLYCLKLNEDMIAYRWGFIHRNIYYDWNASHNIKYERYSPGMVVIGMIVRILINQNIWAMDFGAGDYNWKKRWATPSQKGAIYELYSANESIIPKIYLIYLLRWRDKIKSLYNYLLEFNIIRKINRFVRPPK